MTRPPQAVIVTSPDVGAQAEEEERNHRPGSDVPSATCMADAWPDSQDVPRLASGALRDLAQVARKRSGGRTTRAHIDSCANSQRHVRMPQRTLSAACGCGSTP